MFKYIAAVATLTLLIAADASANDSAALAGEATSIVTDIMREVFKVLVEFIGDVLDEIVRALKEFF